MNILFKLTAEEALFSNSLVDWYNFIIATC